MSTVFTVPTPAGGHRNCDARCHTATRAFCTCICGGALHGFSFLSDSAKRLRISANRERFNSLSERQVRLINRLLPFPEVLDEPQPDLFI